MAFENREWLSFVGGGILSVLSVSNLGGINDSVVWQDAIFSTLSVLFAILSVVALVQYIRIALRVPQCTWTLQKIFHAMNFAVVAARAVIFGIHKQVFKMSSRVLVLMLLDLPGLLFFSTYTLIVFLWAEIYRQAKYLPPDNLKLFFISINAGMYLIQIGIWFILWLVDSEAVEIIGRIFFAVVSLLAAISFAFYGKRLFDMLKQFPMESNGRTKKLCEVGSIAAICFTCFLIRCIVVLVSAFDKDASLDVWNHPVLDFCYYMLVEILPSALVLFILRKLPPKRVSSVDPAVC